MKRVAFASHVAFIDGKEYDGLGNSLAETLSSATDDFLFVRHSMDGKLSSEVRRIHKGEVQTAVDLCVARSPAPLRYVMEVVKTVRYFSRKEKVDVYIGIDPLNALAGVLLKKRGKIEKVVFYTADYSTNRFGNKLMSKIYHFIDKYCVKNVDEVWSVSSRIVAIRKKMGLPDEKNILLPNVPPKRYDKLRSNPHEKYTLITSGIIDEQLDFKGIFDAIKELKEKYPKLHFKIAGNGPQRPTLEKYVKKLGIEKHVSFFGHMPLGDYMEHVSRAGVGLALYTGVWGFNEYGDSTKCREFFNFGLPVLSTDTHSTVEDIKRYGCGVITDIGKETYVTALDDIFQHYERYVKASRKLGEKYSGVHKLQVERILSEKAGSSAV